jgi:hypothetical protein
VGLACNEVGRIGIAVSVRQIRDVSVAVSATPTSGSDEWSGDVGVNRTAVIAGPWSPVENRDCAASTVRRATSAAQAVRGAVRYGTAPKFTSRQNARIAVAAEALSLEC